THIPRPFAYTEIKGMRAMAMEQIHGYTLKELQDAGVSIAEPGWQELEYMLIEINKKYGIVHRDLHTGNIMLETDDDISKQKTVSGTLKFIDLGLAKQTYGSFSPEDFQLTIGDHIVRFPGDRDQIEKLKPNRRSSYNVFTH
ncbi:MAG TPA: AarF/UbiB family protein, partial [Candidatus Paceibacterota bacterium]|nr:AarF/UbiB family protein [Candidatus Paceibacterota bacterium]